MKPIHVLLSCIAIQKIIFGSSGHGGKDAADKLVSYLKEGYSTVINPDGPAGPEKVLKKGVLYVAQASGVPVVPLKINVGWALNLPTWDHKKIPLPFTTIEVIYEKPILVTEENLESAEKYITQHMS